MACEFLTVINDASSDKLLLPKKFAESLEGRRPRELKLCEVGNGRSTMWDMDVAFDKTGRMFLVRGWERFVRVYGLKDGYVLTCSYDGGTVITVKIFDLSFCRVHYDDTYKGSVKMDLPGFEFYMPLREAPSDKVMLPKKFAKLLKDRAPHELKLLEVDDVSSSPWDIDVRSNAAGRMFLVRGWEQFAQSYRLQQGSFLLFNFDSDALLTVKMFNLAMCRRHFSYVDDTSTDSGPDPSDDSGDDSDGNADGSYSSDENDDGSDESDVCSYSSHDNDNDRLFIMRGPGIRGNRPFDEHCLFGNEVWLNGQQVIELNRMVEEAPGKPLKYFIYKMTRSTLDKEKGKMVFGPEYTRSGLHRFLTELVEVNFGCTANPERFNMILKMAADKNKAITVTCGWRDAMKSYKIQLGKYVIFSFQPVATGLHLHMTVMEDFC